MMAQLDAIKAVHDAAVALGANCNSDSCSMWEPFAYDYKSATLVRAQALTVLSTLN